jgi:hypothetical protein
MPEFKFGNYFAVVAITQQQAASRFDGHEFTAASGRPVRREV